MHENDINNIIMRNYQQNFKLNLFSARHNAKVNIFYLHFGPLQIYICGLVDRDGYGYNNESNNNITRYTKLKFS